jgi:hypothetical protein
MHAFVCVAPRNRSSCLLVYHGSSINSPLCPRSPLPLSSFISKKKLLKKKYEKYHVWGEGRDQKWNDRKTCCGEKTTPQSIVACLDGRMKTVRWHDILRWLMYETHALCPSLSLFLYPCYIRKSKNDAIPKYVWETKRLSKKTQYKENAQVQNPAPMSLCAWNNRKPHPTCRCVLRPAYPPSVRARCWATVVPKTSRRWTSV